MLLLITYDVNTQTAAGKKRLRKVADYCLKYGQRVQNSVFECSVDMSQFTMIRNALQQLIDEESDSLRFYNLGDHYNSRIIHVGAKKPYDPEGLLMV